LFDKEELREKIQKELARLQELRDSGSKDIYRSLHENAVKVELQRSQTWICKHLPKYMHYFAHGHEVHPTQIQPLLVEVTETWHADLFRLARLTWSLPFTRGYGRRIKFLLLDESNGKLIGVLGLQSPPLDFPARDKEFQYPNGQKPIFVNQTMDIYTLGAIPPYNFLLGGKLVAFAASSNEIRQVYVRKYSDVYTQMDKRKLPPNLVALTTVSAFGRSSIYNRLSYKGKPVAKSLGYTEGYGSFHLAPLYSLITDFLKSEGVVKRGGFGVGPRIVWQNCLRALDRLGLPRSLLKHGIKREAFIFPLIQNLQEYLSGIQENPQYYDFSFSELSQWWRERWLLGRSERTETWKYWRAEDTYKALILNS